MMAPGASDSPHPAASIIGTFPQEWTELRALPWFDETSWKRQTAGAIGTGPAEA